MPTQGQHYVYSLYIPVNVCLIYFYLLLENFLPKYMSYQIC